jgi:hypothetical protein
MFSIPLSQKKNQCSSLSMSFKSTADPADHFEDTAGFLKFQAPTLMGSKIIPCYNFAVERKKKKQWL